MYIILKLSSFLSSIISPSLLIPSTTIKSSFEFFTFSAKAMAKVSGPNSSLRTLDSLDRLNLSVIIPSILQISNNAVENLYETAL